MKKKELRIKILSGMLCTGLVFFGANLTFAAEKNNVGIDENVATSIDIRVPMDKEKVEQERQAQMKVTLEAVIADSVSSKIITQAEGDKVLEHVKLKSQAKSGDAKIDRRCKNGKCEGGKGGLFNELVTEGILTVEKSEALREKLHLKNTELRHEKLKNDLSMLVTNKVLTVEQSNKVKEAIMAREIEKNENYKKMKDMTEKERKDYMKKIKSSKVNPMKVLIDNGTITIEQEKEIQKILPHYNHGKHGVHGKR
ncbi:hypothetical protein [Clostridium sp.]|uniref:hypothetical protein n=1 Tax=Clostridium sp. TaxID=1506 RepID=UPI003D6C8335